MGKLEDSIHGAKAKALDLSKMAYQEHLERSYEIKKLEAGLEAARANHLHEEVKAISRDNKELWKLKRKRGSDYGGSFPRFDGTTDSEVDEHLWSKTDSEVEDSETPPPRPSNPGHELIGIPVAYTPRSRAKGSNGKGRNGGKAATKVYPRRDSKSAAASCNGGKAAKGGRGK